MYRVDPLALYVAMSVLSKCAGIPCTTELFLVDVMVMYDSCSGVRVNTLRMR